MKAKKTKNESLKEELKKDADTVDSSNDTDAKAETTKEEESAVSISEFTSGVNFEHSLEKYKDNMSTAITFFLCGVGGLIILVLNWFGIINIITGKDTSSMVIYISLLVLFIVFIGIAIYSIKAAKKVKTKIKSENDYSEQIEEWVESHVIPEVIDASYNSEGLPSEIKYFERSAFLTRVIKTEFPDAPDDLVDSIVDDYIERMFHVLERALAEEAEDEDAEYEDENDTEKDDAEDEDDTGSDSNDTNED